MRKPSTEPGLAELTSAVWKLVNLLEPVVTPKGIVCSRIIMSGEQEQKADLSLLTPKQQEVCQRLHAVPPGVDVKTCRRVQKVLRELKGQRVTRALMTAIGIFSGRET